MRFTNLQYLFTTFSLSRVVLAVWRVPAKNVDWSGQTKVYFIWNPFNLFWRTRLFWIMHIVLCEQWEWGKIVLWWCHWYSYFIIVLWWKEKCSLLFRRRQRSDLHCLLSTKVSSRLLSFFVTCIISFICLLSAEVSSLCQ